MSVLILYESKYQSTKQYCKWLAEEIPNSKVLPTSQASEEILKQFDIIVVGSCTYGTKIAGVRFLIKNWNLLSNKKIYLFAVGMIPVDHEDSKKSFELIPDTVRNNLVGYTKLLGRLDTNKLHFVEKIILKIAGQYKDENKMDKNSLQPIITKILSL